MVSINYYKFKRYFVNDKYFTKYFTQNTSDFNTYITYFISID